MSRESETASLHLIAKKNATPAVFGVSGTHIETISTRPPAPNYRPGPVVVFSSSKEISMFCNKSATAPVTSASTVDAGKIRLGGGYRLPVKSA